MVIYICHRFRSDPVLHRVSIQTICRRAIDQGLLPIAPQLWLPSFIDEKRERKLAMRVCVRLLRLVEQVWVFGDLTEGMRIEIAEAERLGIPVVFVDEG